MKKFFVFILIVMSFSMLKAQSPNADSDLVWKYYPEGDITDFKLTADNSYLVFLQQFKSFIYYLDPNNGDLVFQIPNKSGSFPYAFDTKDSVIAVGNVSDSQNRDVQIDIYNYKTQKYMYSLTDDSLILTKYNMFRKVNFSKDGKYLLASAESYNYGGSLFLWDLETKKVIRTFRHNIGAEGAIIDRQNRYIAARYNGHIAIIDFNTFKLIKEMPQDVRGFDFSPDGKYLATCGADGYIKIWDINSNFTLFKDIYYTRAKDLRHIKFTPDSKYIVSGGGGIAILRYGL